jgi:nucleoid-associated protein YgaU
MGKVEKFVVLTVLFVIAVVLVVSLGSDNPLDKDNAAKLGEKPAAKSDTGSTLLSATVQTQTPPPAATPSPAAVAQQNTSTPAATPAPAPAPSVVLPAGALLKTTEGLSPSFDDKRLFYRWQQGDGWVKLAERLYGNATKFSLLKNANEGRDDIEPGEQILVPIFDSESLAQVPVLEPAKNEVSAAAKSEKASKKAPTMTGGKIHEVKKGESLWKIAKSELGDGNRWKEIYELNKDQMKSPEAVRLGMKLKLP